MSRGLEGLFDFGIGVRIGLEDTLFANIEMPGNFSKNRSVMYPFEPMWHDNSVFRLLLLNNMA